MLCIAKTAEEFRMAPHWTSLHLVSCVLIGFLLSYSWHRLYVLIVTCHQFRDRCQSCSVDSNKPRSLAGGEDVYIVSHFVDSPQTLCSFARQLTGSVMDMQRALYGRSVGVVVLNSQFKSQSPECFTVALTKPPCMPASARGQG